MLGIAFVPTEPPTTTTTLNPLLARKQQLAAMMEQLKSKLVIADSEQLTAMRARKEEVKAKLLADLEASKLMLSQKTAEARQQFEDAKERNAVRNAEFRDQVASQLTLFTLSPPEALVVEPTTTASADGDSNAANGESVLGAAAQPVLPGLGAGLLQPALHQLRNLLTPGSAALVPPPAGSGAAALQRLLPGGLPPVVQSISGPERALLQQVKAKAYLSGLTAKATAQKHLLRKKLLTKPGGLGAWARSVRWHHWNVNWFYIDP